MVRLLALSVSSAVLALPAFAAGTVDPATVTCKEYNQSSHQGMVDINAAMHEALKNDPKLGALGQYELADLVDKVCADKPASKVMDALHQ